MEKYCEFDLKDVLLRDICDFEPPFVAGCDSESRAMLFLLRPQICN
jgi:hypothetical protein